MDWLKRMNEALEYIENNLDGKIDYGVLAQKACCSSYHFQRMFSYMAEVPLSEYIRRRRLTKAAYDLQNTEDKVIDIASKYSYDSPTSFTRAFQKLHGITPAAARQQGASLKAYPPITFQVSIKGATVMNYKIEEKESFRIVGFKLSTTLKDDTCYRDIPSFWNEIAMGGKIGALGPMINQSPFGMLGISVCHEPFSDSGAFDFDYYIAAPTDQAVSDEMEEFIVPAATWAIFECIGPMPDAIQEMQKRIATEWLPSSGYEYGGAPDIEVYYDEDGTKADTRSEIWIPVVQKD